MLELPNKMESSLYDLGSRRTFSNSCRKKFIFFGLRSAYNANGPGTSFIKSSVHYPSFFFTMKFHSFKGNIISGIEAIAASFFAKFLAEMIPRLDIHQF